MRNPSIHIRRSDLIKVLEDLGIDPGVVDLLMAKAKKYSINDRIILQVNNTTRKKVEAFVESENDMFDRFKVIYQGFLKENSIFSRAITKSDPRNAALRDISVSVKDFCEQFGLNYTDGAKLYLRRSLEILRGSFTVNRLRSIPDKIFKSYEYTFLLSDLGNRTMADQFYSVFKSRYNIELHTDEDMAHMYYAAVDAKKAKATYQDWIDAQIEKWSFLNTVPNLSQFHGPNAALNYSIYKSKKLSDDTQGLAQKIREKGYIPFKEGVKKEIKDKK